MTKKTSPLLINEPPLQVLPTLAVKVDLNEAIFLQQLHYWLKNPKAGKVQALEKWIYNTHEEWQEQLPFWSVRTVQRIIKSLEKKKLVITGSFNKYKTDRTKWYRIDYAELAKLAGPSGQDDQMDVVKVDTSTSGQNGEVNTIDSTETSPETTIARPRNFYFDAVAEACKSTPTYIKRYASSISRAATMVKADVTVEEFEDRRYGFAAWWYKHDFRGKDDDVPLPRWIEEKWPTYLAWRTRVKPAHPTMSVEELEKAMRGEG